MGSSAHAVPHRRAIRRASVLLAVAAAVGLALLLGLAPAGVLFVAPALLLAAVLGWGTYPGEELLVAVAARSTPSRRRTAAPAYGRRHVVVLPRGGRLVAARLAGRAPPAALLAPA
jgi:hypothetical protein